MNVFRVVVLVEVRSDIWLKVPAQITARDCPDVKAPWQMRILEVNSKSLEVTSHSQRQRLDFSLGKINSLVHSGFATGDGVKYFPLFLVFRNCFLNNLVWFYNYTKY
jgi:hypothetical protein